MAINAQSNTSFEEDQDDRRGFSNTRLSARSMSEPPTRAAIIEVLKRTR